MRSRSRARSLARVRDLEIELDHTTTPHVGFDYSLFYAWAYAQLFARVNVNQHDHEWQQAMAAYATFRQDMITLAKEARLTVVAQTLATQPLPTVTTDPQTWQLYADALYALLQQRDLAWQWDFSDEQIETLERYFAANELLIQCPKVATVTDRQAIWHGLLEPPVPSVEDKSSAVVESAKQAGKPWWKLW